MSNILIVESKNDKIFIEKVIEILNLNNVKIDPPICINEYECLDGLSQIALMRSLKSLSADLAKRDIRKVGIVIDQDNETFQSRLDFVNECIEEVFEKNNDVRLRNISSLIEVQTKSNIPLELGCYFMNMDGRGELETVLKAIKTKDSPFADCLQKWRDCLKIQNKSISDKDFDKFWVNNYIRFDTCSKKELKQAGRKCSMNDDNFTYILQKKADIFDFESPILDGLKNFLQLFTD